MHFAIGATSRPSETSGLPRIARDAIRYEVGRGEGRLATCTAWTMPDGEVDWFILFPDSRGGMVCSEGFSVQVACDDLDHLVAIWAAHPVNRATWGSGRGPVSAQVLIGGAPFGSAQGLRNAIARRIATLRSSLSARAGGAAAKGSLDSASAAIQGMGRAAASLPDDSVGKSLTTRCLLELMGVIRDAREGVPMPGRSSETGTGAEAVAPPAPETSARSVAAVMWVAVDSRGNLHVSTVGPDRAVARLRSRHGGDSLVETYRCEAAFPVPAYPSVPLDVGRVGVVSFGGEPGGPS